MSLISISDVELLLEQADELDVKASLMSSLSWSLAFQVGSNVVRLHRLDDEEDYRFKQMSADDRERETKRLEARIEQLQDYLGWAAAQANPDYLPAPEDVAKALQEPMEQQIDLEDVPFLAKEWGCSEHEIRDLKKRNEERFKQEAELSAEAAKLCARSIEAHVRRGLDAAHEFEEISLDDAIRWVDKIAEKAAEYATNTVATGLRTRRERRRRALQARAELLRRLEAAADDLLDRLTHERDAITDDSPVEAAVKATAA